MKTRKVEKPANGEAINNGKIDKKTKSLKKVKLSKEAGDSAINETGSKPKITESDATAETATKNSLKLVDATIFQHFTSLTSGDEQECLDAALQLINHLVKIQDKERRQTHLEYGLKRLIRGCGASTNNSRSGFYTGLQSVLKCFSAEDLPLQLVFDTIDKELHVGSSIANKEDSYAVVGKILTCTALLKSGRLVNADDEHLKRFTVILLQSSRYRTYHASLAYAMLIMAFEQIPLERFESVMWPLLQKEIFKPWSKQTMSTICCLIASHKAYPTVIDADILNQHFGDTELLNNDSYKHLYRIFFEVTNTDVLTQPTFEIFGEHIASNSQLNHFWSEVVDAGLKSATKLQEIISLRILTNILNNFENVHKNTKLLELLSPNFMQMFVEGLKQVKQKKKDDASQAFYMEFVEALVTCHSKLSSDAEKVAVIQRLLLPPGVFDIEKYTNTRIVHQMINSLEKEGVKDIFAFYKNVFTAQLSKNETNTNEKWQSFERLNAGYMLQHLLGHKAVQNAHKWRRNQLSFFLTCGVFHVNDELKVCKQEQASSFSKDYGEQCKHMFYTSMQGGKLSCLKEEKKLLQELVSQCNEQLTQHEYSSKYLRVKCFNETAQKSWQQMWNTLTKIADKDENDQLNTVFPILLQHIGLQLFREPDMAGPAIDDLLQCMQHAKKQLEKTQKKKKNGSKTNQTNEEPNWMEVVVDLLLHLLSQNTSSLRSIVNVIFQHFCKNLNLNAVHHILSMLDMKDGLNPLSGKNDESDDDDNDDDDENEKESVSDAADDDNSDDDDEEADDTDSDDDDDEEEEDDEDEDTDVPAEGDDEVVTANEKLRNAISEALMANGAATAADDDMASIDLNDISEEDGLKLDEAIATAFKAMGKKTGAGENKKSKSYRSKVTTVMHFRIRVLELVEIYLHQQPTLLIVIETMLALFDMLQYCTSDELKPLRGMIERVLNKLTSQKFYAPDGGDDEKLKQSQLVDFVRIIVEKRTPTIAYDLINKLRHKCIMFLIVNATRIPDDNEAMLALCQEYLCDFVKSRNSTVNLTLFADILKLRWSGVWQLAASLAELGVLQQTRIFRRIQAYELLSVLYRNHELQKQNNAQTLKFLKRIEVPLRAHMESLASTDSPKKTSGKEFQALIELILNIERTHSRLNPSNNSPTTSTLCNNETRTLIQNIRQRVRLDTMHAYQSYCTLFKLKVIRNKELKLSTEGNNANDNEETNCDENDISKDETSKEQKANGVGKRKADNAPKVGKQKKLKKKQRMEAASKGMNGGIFFASGGSVEDANSD